MKVIDEILEAAEGSGGKGESCDWLNVALKYVFVELFPIPRVRTSIEAVLEEMLQGFRRGSTGYFVRHAELLDLDYGQQPPMLLRPRLITRPASHRGITTLAFDLKYTGGLVMVARLDLIGDWQVFLRLRLCELAGPAFLMFQGTDVFYGLRTMDQVKVRTQLVINGVQFRLINWIVGRLLMVDVVRRKLVFPAMKSHFMVPPDTLKEWTAAAAAYQQQQPPPPPPHQQTKQGSTNT